jgi:uncharacterized protein (AIM24 family)
MAKTRRSYAIRRRGKTRTKPSSQHAGQNQDIQATILDQASTQILRISIPPGKSILADQNTMSYMTGDLVPTARTGGAMEGAGFWSGVKRLATRQSFFINHFENKGNSLGEITLSPAIPSAIAEISIQPGEEWKVYPGCVLAATSNVKISGTLNIFENFRASFVTDTAVYSTVGLKKDETTPGRVWITGFGGIETRNITPTETPFILNNGTFLAMPARYWNDYVDVGKPTSLIQTFLTNIGFVMKIVDRGKSKEPVPTFPLYTQTINIHNFKNMIQTIASAEVKKSSGKTTLIEIQ